MASLELAAVRTLCRRALERCRLHERATEAICDVIVAAERDRARSHGLFRLPGFCAALLHGKVDPGALPLVEDAAPAVVRVDGGGGFAPPAFAAGRPLLVAKARSGGVAMMAVRHQCHFSALWYECEALAKDNIGCVAFVNSKAFVAHPGGSAERVYGTNPMAFGWPRAAGKPPLVFDQASAAMARGEMQLLAARDGAMLPEGAALDRDGQPTREPSAGLAGAQLPYGGHKGANICLMVELLCGALAGGNFGFEAHASDPDWYGPTCNGELLIAFDPARFGGAPAARGEALLTKLEAMGGGVRLPGSRRLRARGSAEAEADESQSQPPHDGEQQRQHERASGPIEVEARLLEEIEHIIAGGMPWSQAYAKAEPRPRL